MQEHDVHALLRPPRSEPSLYIIHVILFEMNITPLPRLNLATAY